MYLTYTLLSSCKVAGNLIVSGAVNVNFVVGIVSMATEIMYFAAEGRS
jgi:hypothetical protein